MPLIFLGDEKNKPYFMPDCLENFRHDARPDQSMAVLTNEGYPVCGRVIDGATSKWVCVLPKEYKYI